MTFTRKYKTALIVILISITITLTGCVERKLTINTQPQGALVELNDEEIGTTPVTVNFNWYGHYNVRIEKPGFETLNTHRNLKAPIHDTFGLDFITGVLWPGQIVDEYEWTFKLSPYIPAERETLIRDAYQMRHRTLTEVQ
jgi:hypothetical protein